MKSGVQYLKQEADGFRISLLQIYRNAWNTKTWVSGDDTGKPVPGISSYTILFSLKMEITGYKMTKDTDYKCAQSCIPLDTSEL